MQSLFLFEMQLLEALEREPKLSSRVGNQVHMQVSVNLATLIMFYFLRYNISFPRVQDNNSLTQMEDCRNMNIKLMR